MSYALDSFVSIEKYVPWHRAGSSGLMIRMQYKMDILFNKLLGYSY